MKGRVSGLISALILVYAFLAPLGNVTRFSAEEGSFGITTVLLVLIVLGSLSNVSEVMYRVPVFRAFALLTLWILAATVFAPEPSKDLINSGTLVLYLLAAMAAYQCICDENSVFRLLIALCLGAGLGALATVVDSAGLLDIPKINEVMASTRTDMGMIMQASGPFARRSAMAIYYNSIIVIGILLPLIYRRLTTEQKALFYTTSVVCILALLLTHNRAGVISAFFAVSIILVGTARSFGVIARLAVIAVLGALIAYGISFWFPDVFIAYEALLGIGDATSLDDFQYESDRSRIEFLQYALNSILSNPIGHGYSDLIGVPGYEDYLIDPHGLFTQVIWGSGIFGIFWLTIVGSRAAVQIFRLLRSKRFQETRWQIVTVLCGAMLAVLIIGMAHNPMSTGILWILFGALVRMVAVHHESNQPIYKSSPFTG